jgi:hypothetical protein
MRIPSKIPVLCLSIQQPWAWLIVHGFKDIENSTWPTEFRGRIYVHAHERIDEEFMDFFELEFGKSNRIPKIGKKAPSPEMESIYRGSQVGGIVGEVDVIDCVTESDSRWFCGEDYGFKLANAKPVEFIRCKGMRYFFPLPVITQR